MSTVAVDPWEAQEKIAVCPSNRYVMDETRDPGDGVVLENFARAALAGREAWEKRDLLTRLEARVAELEAEREKSWASEL